MTDVRWRLFRLCRTAAAVRIAATPALAAGGEHGRSELVFVAQLALLMLVGRLLGEAMIAPSSRALRGS